MVTVLINKKVIGFLDPKWKLSMSHSVEKIILKYPPNIMESIDIIV